MPRSKEEFERIKEKRRNEIIKAATYIFAFNNYQSVTTDTITNAVKCSHGLFYHYYKSKEQLFVEVVNSAINMAKTIVDFKNISLQNAKESLRTILNSVLSVTVEKDNYATCCLYLLLNLRLQVLNVDENEEIQKKCVLALNKIHQLIEKGQEENSINNSNPDELTICLIALLEGLLYNRLMVGASSFCCPSVDILMRIVER